MSKYPNTLGRIEAVWNILGGEDGVDRLLRGEITIAEPDRRFEEKDGVIYITVTSDGKTGAEWVAHFEKKGIRLTKYAKSFLLSDDFKPTKGVTYRIAILKGMLFSDSDRVTKKIRAEADRRNLGKPNAEVGCLIRDNFSDDEIEAMGLIWIVAMHEPIEDSDGSPGLLGASRGVDGRWLHAYGGHPGSGWFREHGFAFVVSQVNA